jgi:hypothetical protein
MPLCLGFLVAMPLEGNMQIDHWEVTEIVRITRLTAQKKEPLLQQRAEWLSRVDGFWKRALLNSRLEEHISEWDRNVLEYLETVRSP